MGLIEDCQTFFSTPNLYDVLGCQRDASQEDLKKSFRKSSLLCHPDKVSEDKKEYANRKFQTLAKVHSILSDHEKRAVYDDTGSIDEENANLEDKDWENYWRLLFPKITKKDIEAYMQKYKGSEEEREDLKKYYVLYEGDMNKLSEAFIGYDVDEEDELRATIKELIEKGDVPSFPNFEKESKASREKREKKLKKEAKECAAAGNDAEDSLVNAIMKRNSSRESQFNDMIQNLEAKYANKGASKKRKK